MAIGRISGQLLKDDLARDGRNLSFDTNLLFLDVINRRIGINNTSPTNDLQVTGTARSTNLTVNTQANIANLTLSTNTITSNTGTLSLNPNASNSVVVQAKLQVDNLQFTSNNINALGTNTDINITPTGQLVVNSNMLVNGNLHATGSITADGNLTLGDANTDAITFNADITSNIVPATNNYYDLGTSGNRWLDVYTKNLYTTNLTATNVTLNNGINLSLYQGKTWYVATNGGDTKSGQHQNDPFASLVKALSVAQSGDTIYIYPGTYTEIFPMTIPVGVTVKGAGIRSVIIQPTSGTRNKDAFLLNGETTVEDLTISNFEYDAGNNNGYAFKLASNFKVSSRSPYIRNISVLTFGSTVRLATNPADDPRGFLSGDAGRGGYFNGAVANSASKDVSVLFHSVTFITPGVDCIISSNGVKIEWLNSFVYFANRGFYLPTNLNSGGGQFGSAKVGLKIPAASRVGTWATGNTITYYDTDGVTVLATGTIASVSGDWVYVTGYQTGFVTVTDRPGKTVYANGGAKLSTAVKKFGTASLTLNGSTDYATVGTTPDFAFGTGAFTLEAWIYNTSQGATNQIIFDFRTTSPSFAPAFYINATTNTLRLAVNGASVLESAATIPLNTWTHIALSKSGTSTKIFINGTQSGPTYTDNNTYIQGPLTIGARFDGTSTFFGYIDDIRISNGVAKYTSNFTAPTSALVGDLDTVLLLHFDGTNNATVFVDDAVTRQDLRTSAGGTANNIAYADYTKFGSEVRSIGSANVYGTYGFVGDGLGCIVYLVSQNFAYVGSGRFSTNDPTGRISANQVVKTNGAKIYYSSIDNAGNFAVGDFFNIDQKTGTVTFAGENFNLPNLNSLSFTDGVNTVSLNASQVQVNNLNLSGNTLTTTTGNLILSAATGTVQISSTKSFVLPIGTVAQRPAPATNGALRFNTDYNWFEGYTGSNWIPLGLVTDLDRTTYIKAEDTPGAGDKTLYFYANNSQVATLTPTTFTTNRVTVGNLDITDNNITPVTANTDINVQPPSTIFTASIATGVTSTFNGSIYGTTLTVSSAPNGAGLVIGQCLSGYGMSAGTFIVSNISGTGTSSSSSWIINKSQTQTTANFNGYISGNVLYTIGGIVGTIGVGQIITGAGIADNTVILSNISNNVVGSTWQISISQTVGSVSSSVGILANSTVMTATTVNMTVTNVSSGAIGMNYILSSTGLAAGTQVTNMLSATGGTGTYMISPLQTVLSTTVNGFDRAGLAISNLRISTNTIENTLADAVTTLKNSGNGYVRILGTNGVVLPSGGSALRPNNPVQGMIRFNTDLQQTELYDGALWGGLAGSTGAINATQGQDIAVEQVLTFG